MADWYPRNRADKRAWHVNFNLKRPDFEAKYLILGTLKPELIADCDWVEWWADTMSIEDDRSQQMTKYFNVISGNDESADPPNAPTWAVPPGQPSEVPPGIEKRIRDVRREVVAATNYSKADGEALGFEAAASDAPDPSAVKPDLKTFSAATGFMFSAVVTGREESDQWQISAAEAGTTSWKVLGTFTGKSGDVTYSDGTDKPVQLQVRVQLRKNNANYGQPSDIVQTTVNP